MKNPANRLLSVNNLTIEIDYLNSTFFAVHHLNFCIEQNEVFALVGESGCGKTITALSILDLLPIQAKWTTGEIVFQHQKVDKNSKHLLKQFRGKKISFIFQNAHTALNPVFRVGRQIQDVITKNLKINSKDAKDKVLALLEQVNFSDPKKIYKYYPHQLSGGMAQRVMIAMALSCKPNLIIADEPTTALDITTQISILQLINSLQKKNKFSLLLISHDLQVVSSFADKIAVMKDGKLVECETKEKLINSPKEIYTKQLLASFLIHQSNKNQPSIYKSFV